jgi:hypothetical protein
MNAHTKIWLGLSLLIGASLRLYFLSTSQWMVEGDEAAVGLQALHILQGERPIFFPGQTYLGNMESYLVAALFAAFGASAFTLKLVPLLFALLFIYLLFQLGREVLESEFVGLLAAWGAALAPAYVVVWSVKARGGYIEALVFAQLAWLWVWRWLRSGDVIASEAKQSPHHTQKIAPLRWQTTLAMTLSVNPVGFYLGLIVGYAVWLNPLTLYILAPLALVALGRIGVAWRAWRSWLPSLITLGIGIGIGQLPLWLYRLAYGDTLTQFTNDVPPPSAWWDLTQQAWQYFWYDGLPTLIGLRAPKEAWHADWRSIVVLIYMLAFGWLVLQCAMRHLPCAARNAKTPPPNRQSSIFNLQSSITLLLITFCAFPIFLVGSLTSANFAALIPDSGLLTRFLLPLTIPLTLVMSAWLASLSRGWRTITLGILLAVNGWSFSSIEAVAFARNEFANQPLPASYADAIDFLQRENVRDVYANHWLGYPLMFEAREAIFAFDHTEAPFGMERFPVYGQRVKAAPRHALIVFNPRIEPNPIDAKLRSLNITFRKQELTHVIIYYNFAPRFEPKMLAEVLQWPYWD